jgi:Kef-type K+ transport system membrane component KefB
MKALLNRVVAEHRLLVVTLAAVLAVNVAVYALVVRPLGARSAGAADRAATAAAALAAAEGELEMAQALVAGKTHADEELSAFYEKVLPADLAAARRLTYASLPALARRTNVKYEDRRTEIEDPEKDERLGHLRIRMTLESDYESFRNFIYQLESTPEFVILDDVTLAENEGRGPLAITLSLSTYFRLKPNGT